MYNGVVHSDKLEAIFIDIITKTYFDYIKNDKESKNINLSEVYVSFIQTMNMFSRDFTKKMHDNFTMRISEINDLFIKEVNIKNNNLIFYNKLLNIFISIVKSTLDSILDKRTNIYESIEYKVKLLTVY